MGVVKCRLGCGGGYDGYPGTFGTLGADSSGTDEGVATCGWPVGTGDGNGFGRGVFGAGTDGMEGMIGAEDEADMWYDTGGRCERLPPDAPDAVPADGMIIERPPEPVLLAVTGDDLIGEARGDVSESELSGLATYSPCAPPRRLERAPCGRRCGAEGVKEPADAPPVLTDSRGGPDMPGCRGGGTGAGDV
jgi:hypothetical protein